MAVLIVYVVFDGVQSTSHNTTPYYTITNPHPIHTLLTHLIHTLLTHPTLSTQVSDGGAHRVRRFRRCSVHITQHHTILYHHIPTPYPHPINTPYPHPINTPYPINTGQ